MPRDDLAVFLARARRVARAGQDLDALTIGAVGRDGHLELLWCDPAKGLGPDLDDLQYTLGDGPTLEAARRGHTVIEPDLTVTEPARWPTFLPAAMSLSLAPLERAWAGPPRGARKWSVRKVAEAKDEGRARTLPLRLRFSARVRRPGVGRRRG